LLIFCDIISVDIASISLAYCANNPVMYSDITGFSPEFWKTALDVFSVIAAVAVVTLIVVAAGATGGLAGAALIAVAFSTGIGVAGGINSAIENGTSIASGVLSGGMKGLAVGTAIGLGMMTGGGAFSALGGLAAFGTALGVNFAAGIGCYAVNKKAVGGEFTWNQALRSGYKQMASSAFAFGSGFLIGASGFYNVPGQKIQFMNSLGNTSAGLLFKGIYYYGFDALIQMM